MLNTSTPVKIRSRENGVEKNSLPFIAELITPQSAERDSVECFVKKGFKNAFSAEIESFLPAMIAIKRKGEIKAALGVRSARTPLFIEQYTKTPIQDLSYFKQQNTKRTTIAEIGNLYSDSSRFTISLFLTMGVAMYLNGYSHVVFAGTQQVIEILNATGSKTHFLCNANINALETEQTCWGSYYQTAPQVVAIDLFQVMCVINANPKYSAMFNQQTAQIAALQEQMTGNL